MARRLSEFAKIDMAISAKASAIATSSELYSIKHFNKIAFIGTVGGTTAPSTATVSVYKCTSNAWTGTATVLATKVLSIATSAIGAFMVEAKESDFDSTAPFAGIKIETAGATTLVSATAVRVGADYEPVDNSHIEVVRV